ncbi:MAG: four-helix bundle copper-binding protein [Aquabacterium sp.]
MSHQTFGVCIEACQACANACDHCAAACLREDDPKPMVDCIAMDMDCAQICRLASSFMSRDSVHSAAVCTLCADICDACGKVCSQHPMDHCQACAVACKRCADECRRMAAA